MIICFAFIHRRGDFKKKKKKEKKVAFSFSLFFFFRNRFGQGSKTKSSSILGWVVLPGQASPSTPLPPGVHLLLPDPTPDPSPQPPLPRELPPRLRPVNSLIFPSPCPPGPQRRLFLTLLPQQPLPSRPGSPQLLQPSLPGPGQPRPLAISPRPLFCFSTSSHRYLFCKRAYLGCGGSFRNGVKPAALGPPCGR